MKKVSSLQKQRENKQMLMSELESLEDKLKLLSNKATRTSNKTTKRQNTENLNGILDRWKDLNTKPPPQEPVEMEPQYEEPDQTPAPQNFLNTPSDFMVKTCESLEKTVLKQIKMCIQYILGHTSKNDPMLMSLISGTNDSIDDYERLYTQLKLMIFMEKMNQGPARNELMAFIFSTM